MLNVETMSRKSKKQNSATKQSQLYIVSIPNQVEISKFKQQKYLRICTFVSVCGNRIEWIKSTYNLNNNGWLDAAPLLSELKSLNKMSESTMLQCIIDLT